MRTLYIDLASHSGLLACISDERLTSAAFLHHRIDDADLFPQVEDLLARAGWSYEDLTNIACVIGPGGFMSLRVGVALANTLSHELKIPACGVHLSDLYYARRPPPPTPPPAPSAQGEGGLWLHSTKKHELFIREDASAEPRCIPLDELRSMLKNGMQWMGELIPEHRAIVDSVGAREAELRPLEEILPAFLNSQAYALHTLLPWYGRGW